MSKFKEGDKVVCVATKAGNESYGLIEVGRTYVVVKVNENRVFISGVSHADYYDSVFEYPEPDRNCNWATNDLWEVAL